MLPTILLLMHVEPILAPKTEFVEIVELNHVYRNDHEHLKQLIFWRYSSSGLTVCDWRMYAKVQTTPVRENGMLIMRWFENNRLRVVACKVFVHTKSTYDPEVEDRNVVPVSRRKHLFSQQTLDSLLMLSL